ncbi:acyl-CoA N-acyltransferase [Ochromonadaceae sp. CCMP2298]|nr:acyl-CoA N-acyltransferase [Ochromonadaceae sp. CCMP2298]
MISKGEGEEMVLPDITYRSVDADDFQSMRALHEQFFPVKYSDKFYTELCQGFGPNSQPLFTCLAVQGGQGGQGGGHIVGFVVAQLFPLSKCEDENLFALDSPAQVCYILTLGVVDSARGYGLGSVLIGRCEEYAQRHADCGAIYLHVLVGNDTAIRLYLRNGYLLLRTIDDFYYFHHSYHPAQLYIRHFRHYQPPTRWAYVLLLVRYVQNLIERITHFIPLRRFLGNGIDSRIEEGARAGVEELESGGA